jgi:uncharacterized protein
VYAPLRQAAFLTTAQVVNDIAALQAGECRSSQNEMKPLLEFLRRLEIVDGAREVLPVTHYEGVPKPTSVTLFLTTQCNLHCTYCYASAGDTPHQAMSLEVARRGIDFVLRNAVELGTEGVQIAYHGGGEPTTNWGVLTCSYNEGRAKADNLGVYVQGLLTTNGVLSAAKLQWVIDNFHGVTVSFDGLPEVHNAHRPTRSGQGSSEFVEQTMRSLDRANFNYGVRMTATNDSIPQLASSVRYICSHFRPQAILIEPAYQLGRWRDAPSAENQQFIDHFRRAQETARALGHEIRFSAARVGTLTNHFCGITRDNFCLTPKGTVSACYESFLEESEQARTFQYGNFDPHHETYRFQLPVLDNLRSQTVDRRDYCNACFAKWSCGGDCYHKSLSMTGSSKFSGSDRCPIIRELTTDQILTEIAAAGGAFWHALRDTDEDGPHRDASATRRDSESTVPDYHLKRVILSDCQQRRLVYLVPDPTSRSVGTNRCAVTINELVEALRRSNQQSSGPRVYRLRTRDLASSCWANRGGLYNESDRLGILRTFTVTRCPGAESTE